MVDEKLMRFSHGNIFNELFILKLSQIRLTGNEKELILDEWLHYLKIRYKEVDRINKMSVAGFFEKRIQALVNEFFKMWVNESEDYEKMKDAEPTGKMKLTAEDFCFKWGSGEHRIHYQSEDELFINGSSYDYNDGKVYKRLGQFRSDPVVRVYLFFDDYYVLRYENVYFIVKTDLSTFNDLIFHDDKSEDIIFKGDKEGLIEKVEEMTGRIWKPNVRMTEFI